MTGINVEINVDDPQEYYSNGDTLRGKVCVECKDSFDVREIEMKLRCEASVTVRRNNSTMIENEKHLTIIQTLFPDPSIKDKQIGAKNSSYTLQPGRHEYGFCLQIPIPNLYPQTIYASSDAKIQWYLKVTLHRGHALTLAKRSYYEFEMRPFSEDISFDQTLMPESKSFSLYVYLPGYAKQLESTAGLLKTLVPRNTHYRRKSQINVTVYKPTGLSQKPSPLDVKLDLSSIDEEHILVRQVKLFLKRKIICTAQGCSDTERKKYAIFDSGELNLPAKAAMKSVNDTLAKSTIAERLPSTYRHKFIEVEYKLVVLLFLASHERNGHTNKLRISYPILLYPFIPQKCFAPQFDRQGVLPSYQDANPFEKGSVIFS